MAFTSQLGSLVGLLVLIQALAGPVAAQTDKVRMCYFSNKGQDRTGLGHFSPANIDPSLCTHILYASAQVSQDGRRVETTHFNDVAYYQQIMNLKSQNPTLKVLLSVGEENSEQTRRYDMMARDPTLRAAFVSSVVNYLRQYNFDGMDVSWKFPDSSNRVFFQQLIIDLWTAFQRDEQQSNRPRLLLTVAAWGNHQEVLNVYDPIRITQYVDYFLLMTYNLWGMGVSKLGHHTALYVRPQDAFDPELGRFSVNKTVSEWLQQGVASGKLVLGLASFGISTRLLDASRHNLGDPHSRSPGTPGPYTNSYVFLAYYEICQNLANSGKSWTSDYVPVTEGALAYSTSYPYDWVCYDNPQSIRAKVEYALQRDLAGVFLSTLDLDDFSGQSCNLGRYPLLSQVKSVFDNWRPTSSVLPSSTDAPSPPSGDCVQFKCPNTRSANNPHNLYRNPFDCSTYYQCVFPGLTEIYYTMDCPGNLRFDPASLKCEFPDKVDCVNCPPFPQK